MKSVSQLSPSVWTLPVICFIMKKVIYTLERSVKVQKASRFCGLLWMNINAVLKMRIEEYEWFVSGLQDLKKYD
ncbi:hypothetical protein Lpp14_13109 [Lacticaseibacillus paracasei subsp. paracasei Lpp14]|uniref:Uncharacterized protein n=2 Tax=Lacticaseibacillus paracasei TaxID=1597 RepID=A0A829GMM3_LACPA|nr:hypothetical protein Lpp14_13109 [Lacticaseibacillus paracasei subsp. paracasei Lpp14]